MVAPCMLITLNPLFVQLMQTQIILKLLNYLKILKLQSLLQNVSVYINHHQGILVLFFRAPYYDLNEKHQPDAVK